MAATVVQHNPYHWYDAWLQNEGWYAGQALFLR